MHLQKETSGVGPPFLSSMLNEYVYFKAIINVYSKKTWHMRQGQRVFILVEP